MSKTGHSSLLAETVKLLEMSLLEGDLSREVGDKLKITQSGKAHNLLKNTKSVTLVLFGNYYQYHKVADVLEVILKSLNRSFEN